MGLLKINDHQSRLLMNREIDEIQKSRKKNIVRVFKVMKFKVDTYVLKI